MRTSLLTRRIATAAAVVFLAGGSASAALAASGSSSSAGGVAAVAAAAPSSSQIAGCAAGSSRTLEHVYTNIANFKPCPSGSFEVGPWNVQGPKGATGAAGPKGATGATGPQGPAGTSAPAAQYGIGQVSVDRGSGATVWAVYSTALGSPVGDTTGGTFRFTCTNVTSGCNVSLQAYATASGYQVYPRISIIKDDESGATPVMSQCEYGDGGDNSGAQDPLTTTAATIPVGVGGTFDCGSTSQTGTPPAGVTFINVPGAGGQGVHYDVDTTDTFSPAG